MEDIFSIKMQDNEGEQKSGKEDGQVVKIEGFACELTFTSCMCGY